MTELPAGWMWETLENVLLDQPRGRKLQQGWSPKCETSPAGAGEWGVLKTTAIQPGRFDGSHNKRLPDLLSPRHSIEVNEGDLLITCAGPRSRCGVPALVRYAPQKLMMSGKMYRFRPNERIDSAFLELWLLSPEAQAMIDKMKTGISDSGLNLTHDRFLALPVPVPPMPVQLQIVRFVEEQLSRIDAAHASLSSAKRGADAWYAGLADELIWGKSWPLVRLAHLLRTPMRNGRSDRAVTDGSPGIRTLTITAVTRNSFTDEHTKITTTSEPVAKKLWLEPGDIFVQRSNTPELVGTAARYAGPHDWAIFPDLLIRIRADEGQVDSRYLVEAIRTERAHRKLRQKAKGLAGSMPKIDQAALGESMVPIPRREDQVAIVEQLEQARESTGRINAAISKAEVRGRALRASLLIAAVTGQLRFESDEENSDYVY